MERLLEATKKHFNLFNKIYKVFIISSVVYFILSFVLFSRTLDLPFDIVLAMVYGTFSIPLLGVFLFHKIFYKDRYTVSISKFDLLTTIFYPVVTSMVFFYVYLVLRVPSGAFNLSDLSDSTGALLFPLAGLVIYITLSYIYLAICKFEFSKRQFIWKISIIIIYIIAFLYLPYILDINKIFINTFIVGLSIIYVVHITIKMTKTYSKKYLY